MPFFKNGKINQVFQSKKEGSLRLGYYFSTHQGITDAWSERILQVKNANFRELQAFTEFFCSILEEKQDISVMVIPSGEPDKPKERHGISVIAQEIAIRTSNTDATNCIKRVIKFEGTRGRYEGTTLEKIEALSASISIQNPNQWVTGKRVLILDDVITSGHSLQCCKDLLAEYQPAEVFALILGRTFPNDGYEREDIKNLPESGFGIRKYISTMNLGNNVAPLIKDMKENIDLAWIYITPTQRRDSLTNLRAKSIQFFSNCKVDEPENNDSQPDEQTSNKNSAS